MLRGGQPLLSAEVCMKPGEFCLHCLLLVTSVLISTAMTELKTSSTLKHLWYLLWKTSAQDCDCLQSKVTEQLLSNTALEVDPSHLSAGH